MPRALTVLKLGGSVLRNEEDLPGAVHEVYRWARESQVVVVVSALAGATDALLAQGRRCSATPDASALAALVATGEQQSAALLALALDRAGVPATVLDPARLRLRAEGPLLEADPVGLDAGAVRAVLSGGAVAVVPGFIGRTAEEGLALLGRGGSDYTALFLADALGAGRCRLLKDVDGLYERDPAGPGPAPRRFAALSWDEALRLDGRIVQHRAVRFARARRLTFEVAALHGATATVVGGRPKAFASVARPRPLRVALVGLGTVGLGVYRHLAAQEERFEVAGITVREPARYRDLAPPALLRRDLPADADVVVEAISDPEAALAYARKASAFVTANKRLVAEHGAELRALGDLRCAATVGGAVPVLEVAASLQGRVTSIEAVLNGTSGFVLDRVAEGATLDDAVRLAQARGFAEADPSRDLDGRDVEAKVRLLARAALGRAPDLVQRTGLEQVDPAFVRAQAPVRLLARLECADGRITADIRATALGPTHPLRHLQGEENGVVFHLAGEPEPIVLRGRGAGRWPTAEAVMADLFDLARQARAQLEEASA